tara:strand:+ start:918 stop:1094 length:177 start_codon:yes stop_codon:yes gene_type:complete
MENLDIIIFTIIVVICFLSFFISTFRAFENLNKKGDYLSNKRGILSRLLAYFESLASE